jgi:hypothetical protein
MPSWSRPGTDLPPEVRRNFERRISVDGLKLKVELLGSVWRGAPFTGIMVSAARGHTVSFTIDRPYAKATKADYDRLIRRIRVAPCRRPGCRKRTLVGATTGVKALDGLCPRHQAADLPILAEKERAELEARMARDDARAKARGNRYKAWVWIHGDGDDYALRRYFRTRPKKEELRRIARAKRSAIVEDFQVERI